MTTDADSIDISGLKAFALGLSSHDVSDPNPCTRPADRAGGGRVHACHLFLTP